MSIIKAQIVVSFCSMIHSIPIQDFRQQSAPDIWPMDEKSVDKRNSKKLFKNE